VTTGLCILKLSSFTRNNIIQVFVLPLYLLWEC